MHVGSVRNTWKLQNTTCVIVKIWHKRGGKRSQSYFEAWWVMLHSPKGGRKLQNKCLITIDPFVSYWQKAWVCLNALLYLNHILGLAIPYLKGLWTHTILWNEFSIIVIYMSRVPQHVFKVLRLQRLFHGIHTLHRSNINFVQSYSQHKPQENVVHYLT